MDCGDIYRISEVQEISSADCYLASRGSDIDLLVAVPQRRLGINAAGLLQDAH